MRRFLATTLLSFSLLTVALPVFAISLPQLVPTCATTSGTFGKPPDPPQLGCVFQMAANIAQIILGLTGAAALLMFVVGGFFMLASGGNDSMVEKGKEYIKNAVIGLAIIMLSGTVLSYAIQKITNPGENKPINQLIVGQQCKATSGNLGTVFLLANSQKVCAATCSDLGDLYQMKPISQLQKDPKNPNQYTVDCLNLPDGNTSTSNPQLCCYVGTPSP